MEELRVLGGAIDPLQLGLAECVSEERSRRVEHLRWSLKLGPARIAHRLDMTRSTVYRVLCRLGLHRLAQLDCPTGRLIRRYEHARPGDQVHMDVKQLGRIPDDGWRAHGRRRDANRATPTPGTPSCTPRSTTTPAWPTARCSPTSARPAL